jgi:O-antigen ligase
MNSAQTPTCSWDGRYDSAAFETRVNAPLASAACVAFALLFFAGDVKGNPDLAWIPFDLTAAVGALALVLAIMSIIARNGKISIQVAWMLALFAAISASITWTQFTPYAVEKITRLFTVSLIAALLPAFMVFRLQQVRLFITSIVASGMLISVGGLLQLIRGEFIGGRMSGISADTIGLGRNSGIALVGLYTLVGCSGKRRIWLAVFCLPLLLVLLGSGSRGPAFSALGVIALVTLHWARNNVRGVLVAALLLAAGVIVIAQNPPLLPKLSVDRIVDFMENRYDSSAEERILAGRAALAEISKTPFGLGLGGFAQIYNYGSVTDHIYPHNIVLELAVESGWLSALLFTFIVAIGVRRAYQCAVIEPSLRPFFAVFLFTIGNSLVSGDLNDNKIIYALLCIALMSRELIARDQTSAATELGY